MRIKLEHSDTLLHIFQCRLCEKHWISRDEDRPMRCTVDHSDGSCCHYGEPEITRDEVNIIYKLVIKLVGSRAIRAFEEQGLLPDETL